MELRWITAFVDLAADRFDAASRFWMDATGTTMSARRGPDGEFATLVPDTGDPVVRVQRTGDDTSGIHLDLHVDDVRAAADEATALGAVVVADPGHVVLRSPAGLGFCVVADGGERRVPAPVGSPPSRLDQIAIDVPAASFAAEVGFWSALLGWTLRPSSTEFRRLEQPDGLPYRLLFQRLADDAPETTARAHLDVSAGDGREDVAALHVELGSTRLATFEHWIVLEDPAGLPYCVTRQPVGP
ncbi:MAG: VOC family protein [Acidimicrobiales bacterium]|nr:VOC family protein [Acidimicrobiales bacterium]